ncbi:hypothetical protein TNCV_1175201 [Trichonephila clavipes]|nr:hypothetical protein TNCV_1175201 [Trichonephila clavipes]
MKKEQLSAFDSEESKRDENGKFPLSNKSHMFGRQLVDQLDDVGPPFPLFRENGDRIMPSAEDRTPD